MRQILSRSFLALLVAVGFSLCGCGQDAPTYAEPEIIAPGDGIPMPEDGMPKGMGEMPKDAKNPTK